MIREGERDFFLSSFFSLCPIFIQFATRKLSSLPRISSGFYWKKRDVDGTESVKTSSVSDSLAGFARKSARLEEWREQHHPGDDALLKVGWPADRKPIIHLNTKPERCTWLKLALFPLLSSPRSVRARTFTEPFPFPRLRSRFLFLENVDFRFPFFVLVHRPARNRSRITLLCNIYSR